MAIKSLCWRHLGRCLAVRVGKMRLRCLTCFCFLVEQNPGASLSSGVIRKPSFRAQKENEGAALFCG